MEKRFESPATTIILLVARAFYSISPTVHLTDPRQISGFPCTAVRTPLHFYKPRDTRVSRHLYPSVQPPTLPSPRSFVEERSRHMSGNPCHWSRFRPAAVSLVGTTDTHPVRFLSIHTSYRGKHVLTKTNKNGPRVIFNAIIPARCAWLLEKNTQDMHKKHATPASGFIKQKNKQGSQAVKP